MSREYPTAEFSETALQEVRERRLMIDQCDAWIFALISPFIGRRVLDMGCGYGNLTRHLLDRDLVVGIDIDEESVANVRATYGQHLNVSAFQCDAASNDLLKLADHQFDTAVSINVAEHIEDDLHTFTMVHDILTPGGKLVIILPAHMQLYGTMDSSIGHYRRYSKGDLAQKMRKAGFEIVVQRYINPIGALGWLVNGRLLRRKVPPVGQLKLFNVIMPVVAVIDRSFQSPFGLSVLTVARRADNVQLGARPER